MQTIDRIDRWDWSENRLTLQSQAATIRLMVLTDSLVRFQVEAPEPGRVLPSGAVIREAWPPVQASVTFGDDWLTLTTGRLRVEVRLSGPVSLSWYDGEQLLARDQAVQATEGKLSLQRALAPGERFYGFGEKTGFLDKRGRRLTMWATDDPVHTEDKDPLYQAVPFFIGLKDGYAHGLFVDCTGPSTFDMGAEDPDGTCAITVESPLLDGYVFAGPAMADVIRQYTELTGRMEMPPYWALGFHQCRWSYFPEARIRELAREFRQREIPCDALWLDIDYMNGYRVFTWDQERFPQPANMIADLATQGFRVVNIVDPGVKVDEAYPVYQEGAAQGYFVRNPDGTIHVGKVWPGESAFPDFLRESTRRWWGDLHKEAYWEKGVAGIWNDMNEPASFIGVNPTERTLPDEVVQGEEGAQVPHRAVHNVYGFRMDQATYEGWKRHDPDRRPFLLTRSGYAGIQRYAAVWLGDNHSWWQHLLLAMPMLSGMGLSGVPFVGVDVGGFSSDGHGELVARWIGLGAFTPFFRMHSAWGTRDQEPWSFGPEVEAIARKYINLRYRLLPFFYTLFEEAHRTGMPIMRPLVLEHQDDPETHHISDQVLIGRDVLVAPVYQPGVTRRLVYLPKGDWYDFWTGARYTGQQYITAVAPLEVLPLYVRAGGVIPMGPVMDYTGQKVMDTLTLHVFAGKGTYELYEDAGEGYGYQQGDFARTRVSVAGNRVEVGAPQGGYRPPWSRVAVVLHGFAGEVTVDGEPVETTPAEGGGVQVLVNKPGGFVLQL